jgi:hypothetical protein
MKWFLPGKVMLHTHINVKALKVYHPSDRLIKNQMRRKKRTMNAKEPTCNEAIEHLNVL